MFDSLLKVSIIHSLSLYLKYLLYDTQFQREKLLELILSSVWCGMNGTWYIHAKSIISRQLIHHSMRILNANPTILFLLETDKIWRRYIRNTTDGWKSIKFALFGKKKVFGFLLDNHYIYLPWGPGSALARTWPGPSGQGRAGPGPGPPWGGPDLKGQGQGRQIWPRSGPDRPVDSLRSKHKNEST